MKKTSKSLTALVLLSGPIVANASLVGSSVTGSLFTPVTNTTTNYFDPANGDVPPGYGNSAGTTVTIANPGVEFAFLQRGGTVAAPGVDSITVNFTGTTLTLVEHINSAWLSGIDGFQVVFTDPAFAGLFIAKTADSFAQGGVNASLVNGQLTLTVGGSACQSACTWPAAQSATFSLSPAPKETITLEATGVLTEVDDPSDLSFSVPVAVGDTFTYDYTVNTATPASSVDTNPAGDAYYGAIVSASFRINGGPQIPITMVPADDTPIISLLSGYSTTGYWEDNYEAGILGVIYNSGQQVVGGLSLGTQDSTAGAWPFFLSGTTLNVVPAPLSGAASRQLGLSTGTNTIAATLTDVESLDLIEAPYVAPGVSGTLGTNGWYVSKTTLAWYVTGSPAPTESGCGKVIVPNTKGNTYTCSATNADGTATGSLTIKVDTAAPKVTITKPANGASYARGSSQIASYSCTDATSGVATCAGTVPDKTKFSTSTLGPNTFTVTATDKAGNLISEQHAYTVVPPPNWVGTWNGTIVSTCGAITGPFDIVIASDGRNQLSLTDNYDDAYTLTISSTNPDAASSTLNGGIFYTINGNSMTVSEPETCQTGSLTRQ
jgi:hypothetical protein